MRIGKHEVRYPLIQGGMGVRVSGSRLAGHVALQGGVGLVATAGIAMNSPRYDGSNYFAAEPLALKDELREAYKIAPDGVIGTNCMVAVTDYDELVRASCEGGAKLIVSGAGLPLNLPELTADWPDVALVPIVSSAKAANIILKKWFKNYARLPDAIIVEDPDTAGGHLGEKLENIGTGEYDQYATVRAVKKMLREEYNCPAPVITAGGVWDRADLEHALQEGADGVQMGTRFVTTEECDADDAFKQAYLNCSQEDIGLIMSPAGLPGRALINNVDAIRERDLEIIPTCPTGCLRKCAYKSSGERFCIVHALDRAQRGDLETGLIFCGTNAWRANRIETVAEIFAELFSNRQNNVING